MICRGVEFPVPKGSVPKERERISHIRFHAFSKTTEHSHTLYCRFAQSCYGFRVLGNGERKRVPRSREPGTRNLMRVLRSRERGTRAGSPFSGTRNAESHAGSPFSGTRNAESHAGSPFSGTRNACGFAAPMNPESCSRFRS
jgi:hypothetical protein